jgi:outer membrane protein OmpA-like peptidoglycan-associated protein
VSQLFFTGAANQLIKRSALGLLTSLLMLIFTGCASSGVQRNAANNVDSVSNTTSDMFSSGDGSMSDSYQNSSQMTKGAIIGGAAGAVTGALYPSSIGLIPGTAGGILLGAVYGAYIDAHTTIEDKLENRGANVIVLGDQMMIILPSSRVFNDGTADVKSQAYSTLQLVAIYINNYTKTLVKVSAYTNDTGSKRVDLALSKEQAANVAKVLQLYGVNARMLYAEGYGGTNLVEQNTRDWDHSDNYRVVITFEKLVV